MKTVAIIGGGITGLSAAWFAKQQFPSTRIVLFESSERLGGVIRTRYESDRILELGADNFASLIPHALKLSQDIGYENELIRPNAEHRFASVVARDSVVPIPDGFSLMQPNNLIALTSSPILSWPGRARVLLEQFKTAKVDFDNDESLESFAVRRLGREAFERLVEPIICGIFTANASTLSMQAAMPQFLKMEQEHGGLIRAARANRRKQTADQLSSAKAKGARYDQFLAPTQGMQHWIDAIAKQLTSCEFRFSVFVDSIVKKDSEWIVQNGNSNESFDAVVLTTPAHETARLLLPLAPSTANLVQSIQYASSVVAGFIVDRDAIPSQNFCFGVVVPTIEKKDILAISFTSEKYSGRLPSSEVYLRIFMGGAVRPEINDWEEGRVISSAWGQVSELLGISRKYKSAFVTRWPQAMPQYTLGHTKRVEKIDDDCERLGNIRVAGAAYRGVGIPQCIRSAQQAIVSLFNSCDARQSSSD